MKAQDSEKTHAHQDQTDQGEREGRKTPLKNPKARAWQPYSQLRDTTQAQKKGTTVTERGSKREWHRPKLARPMNKPDGKEKPSRNSEMEGQRVRTIKPPRTKCLIAAPVQSITQECRRPKPKQSAHLNRHRDRTVKEESVTKKQKKNREDPTLLSTTRKNHWEQREKNVHQLKAQRNTSYIDQGCRHRARTIGQENARPGRERSP